MIVMSQKKNKGHLKGRNYSLNTPEIKKEICFVSDQNQEIPNKTSF